MKVLALLIFFVCIQLAYPTPWSHSVDEVVEIQSPTVIEKLLNPLYYFQGFVINVIRTILKIVLTPLKILFIPVNITLWFLRIILFPLRVLCYPLRVLLAFLGEFSFILLN
ncbi:uncharacterized protein LOC112904545 isoform X2 [Agrilus planipennis]|uniref:Uncharacterized protein LOC112904545 isoform X2 n=1 Tax=Agrilus planipennis TaxID=224129 RepID=A0A7F5QZ25_AGRPL|nr:uncharacterized protein LOC112904545 isoform X2 [Agrilus planipennis]